MLHAKAIHETKLMTEMVSNDLTASQKWFIKNGYNTKMVTIQKWLQYKINQDRLRQISKNETITIFTLHWLTNFFLWRHLEIN